MDGKVRKALAWNLWLVTWIILLIGYYDRSAWDMVVTFSAAHALLFFILFQCSVEPFPVQVRLAYLAWVAAGTYVEGMEILMWITTVGEAFNLFAGYCPLARMLSLLPWNREEALSWNLVKKAILSRPPMDT